MVSVTRRNSGSGGGEQSLVVVQTGIADPQVNRDAGEPIFGVSAGEPFLHVEVEQIEGFGAARVKRVCPQEPLQR